MIKGLGIDIVEIERIKKAIDRHGQRFLDKLFTEKEQDYCLSHIHSAVRFAVRFAAKEAVAKALGTGFRGIGFKDIEVSNDATGKPSIVLSLKVEALYQSPQIVISLSHSKDYATACAIWLCADRN